MQLDSIKQMNRQYDIIVIGAGSGGLGVSLFMTKTGLKTLLVDKTDKDIGGDCLNYGCVPSKALIHVSRILHQMKEAGNFGLHLSGVPDLLKATQYVKAKQDIIRKHENADFLRQQGMDVVLGRASFHDKHSVKVNSAVYKAKRIILATGSRPASLQAPGIEKVKQYNNESIFDIKDLPKRLLVVGGGPIGVEMGQAMHRLGSEVTIIDQSKNILPHDDAEVTGVLLRKLQAEGIRFIMGAEIMQFTSAHNAVIKNDNGETQQESFDAVLVAIGRTLELGNLELDKAGIQVKENKIVVNKFLQTTNKNVLVCGDIAGSLNFSHAAEQHARLILNNLFSPFKKKLDNSHMSWVTFTDPEIATFGLQELFLKRNNYSYERIEMDFGNDDRAVIDDNRYGKLILFLSKGNLIKKTKILGGSMVSPGAGELIQELILANTEGLNINAIFNKIYPYPVASRVNQLIIVKYKEKQLTETVKKVVRFLYKLFN
jgi:pyruvate/2-oxoglutarate dehydrogenase complex dihydrolipoamide dehydrogenase (E3) component